MIIRILLLFFFAGSSVRAAAADTWDVRKFGARGDGKTLDTRAIQRAVDRCAASGGGTVRFSPGYYLTATIFLKDNVTLDIPAGATVLGATDIALYPVLTPEIAYYGRDNTHFSLFYAEKGSNITLQGAGTIDGQGAAFTDASPAFPKNYNARPFIFWFVQVKGLKVTGLHLKNSGFWMQHYLNCEEVLIDGIHVFNHSNKNNDMMDIDGCRNVRITNCTGDSDDDGITLKSMNEYPTEDVTISNCLVSSHCNAIKCGTESSGGFRNIVVTNCVIRPSAVQDRKIYGNVSGNSGITLATVDGAVLDGIVISNIRMEGPQSPIFLRLGNRARPYRKDQGAIPVGILRNVRISGIVATGASRLGCLLAGLPEHPIENIHLSDISISFSGKGTAVDAERVLPENEKKYPDAEQFGLCNAYGFQIRHARNVSLQRIQLQYDAVEERPALVLQDVDEAFFSEVSAKVTDRNGAFMTVAGSGKVVVANCGTLFSALTPVFVRTDAASAGGLLLKGNDLRLFGKAIQAPPGAETLPVLSGNIVR